MKKYRLYIDYNHFFITCIPRHRDPANARRPAMPCTAALVLCLLWACTGPPLNSERIERRYGSYGVTVLEQSPDRRLSNLYSLEGGRPVCRTLAIVRFQAPLPRELAPAHAAILAGGSIGAVLEAQGWRVNKVTRHVGEFAATDTARRLQALMSIELPASIAMHVYELSAARGSIEIPYATIVELHHPDYLSVARLTRLYGPVPEPTLTAAELDAIRARAQQSVTP